MKPVTWSFGWSTVFNAKRQLDFSSESPPLGHLSLGGVETCCVISKEKLTNAFPFALDALKEQNYILSDNVNIDICMAQGNIDAHEDTDLGVVALILLSVEPLCDSQACSIKDSWYDISNYLWTKHGLTSMREGDMAVFDTDLLHAWFCPGTATFLTIPIEKPRKRKCGNVGLP